jgi:hypothetical protein
MEKVLTKLSTVSGGNCDNVMSATENALVSHFVDTSAGEKIGSLKHFQRAGNTLSHHFSKRHTPSAPNDMDTFNMKQSADGLHSDSLDKEEPADPRVIQRSLSILALAI